MEKNTEFGIDRVKFAPLAANGTFPDFTTSTAVSIGLIAVDSFTHAKEDNTFREINREDISQKLTLPGSGVKKTLIFTSKNVSVEACEFFKGFDNSRNLAMQYVTIPVARYNAFIHEFTPVAVTVMKTGNTGKNGLPALQFACTFLSNFDAAGKFMPNHRYKTA